MRNLVLGKSHNKVLIGAPYEAIMLVLETDDVIDKLCNPKSLEILSKSYKMSAISLFWIALSIGLDSPELHSIGSTEQYNVALSNLQYCFETRANTSKQLKVNIKALFYCKSDNGDADSYHQHTHPDYW